MEIYRNPLTIEHVEVLVDRATQASIDPNSAYQRTLHFSLLNCVQSNNLSCMDEILGAYPDIDIDRTHGRGSLLFNGVAVTLIGQGPTKLCPFKRLLEARADPSKRQEYQIYYDYYRQGRTPHTGNVMAYLNHIEGLLVASTGADKISRRLGSTLPRALLAVRTARNILEEMYPWLDTKGASFTHATRSGFVGNYMMEAVLEARTETGREIKVVDASNPSLG